MTVGSCIRIVGCNRMPYEIKTGFCPIDPRNIEIGSVARIVGSVVIPGDRSRDARAECAAKNKNKNLA